MLRKSPRQAITQVQYRRAYNNRKTKRKRYVNKAEEAQAKNTKPVHQPTILIT